MLEGGCVGSHSLCKVRATSQVPRLPTQSPQLSSQGDQSFSARVLCSRGQLGYHSWKCQSTQDSDPSYFSESPHHQARQEAADPFLLSRQLSLHTPFFKYFLRFRETLSSHSSQLQGRRNATWDQLSTDPGRPGGSETGNKSRHRFAVCAIPTRNSEKQGKVWVSLTGQLSLHWGRLPGCSPAPVPGPATLGLAGLGQAPGAPTSTPHSHRCADTEDLAVFLERIQAQASVKVKGQADTVGTPACGQEPQDHGPWPPDPQSWLL